MLWCKGKIYIFPFLVIFVPIDHAIPMYCIVDLHNSFKGFFFSIPNKGMTQLVQKNQQDVNKLKNIAEVIKSYSMGSGHKTGPLDSSTS